MEQTHLSSSRHRRRPDDKQFTLSPLCDRRGPLLVFRFYPKLADFLGWRPGESIRLSYDPEQGLGKLIPAQPVRYQTRRLLQHRGRLELRWERSKAQGLFVLCLRELSWQRDLDGALCFALPGIQQERSPLPRYNGRRVMQLLNELLWLSGRIHEEADIHERWRLKERLARVLRLYRFACCAWEG